MTKVNTTKGNGTTTGRPDVLGTGNNKNATHKKRVVTQTFVVHKWSVTITDHLKKKKKKIRKQVLGGWGVGPTLGKMARNDQ